MGGRLAATRVIRHHPGGTFTQGEIPRTAGDASATP
jgi:hypothetical protein